MKFHNTISDWYLNELVARFYFVFVSLPLERSVFVDISQL